MGAVRVEGSVVRSLSVPVVLGSGCDIGTSRESQVID